MGKEKYTYARSASLEPKLNRDIGKLEERMVSFKCKKVKDESTAQTRVVRDVVAETLTENGRRPEKK